MTATGGSGLYKDFSWGDISASVTTGSGMPVYFKGINDAARISYGVLSRDNSTSVFPWATANPRYHGYKLRDPEPQQMRLAGA